MRVFGVFLQRSLFLASVLAFFSPSLLGCAGAPSVPLPGSMRVDRGAAVAEAEGRERHRREDAALAELDETVSPDFPDEWNTGPDEELPDRWNAVLAAKAGNIMMDDNVGSVTCDPVNPGPDCLFEFEKEALRAGRSTRTLDHMRASGMNPHLGDAPGYVDYRGSSSRSNGRVFRPERPSSPAQRPDVFIRTPKRGDTWWGYGSELALTYEQMAELNGLDYREVAQGKHLVEGRPVNLSRSGLAKDRKRIVAHNTRLSHRYDGERVRRFLKEGIPGPSSKASSKVSKASKKKTSSASPAGQAQADRPAQRVFGSKGKRFDQVAAHYGFRTYVQLRQVEAFNAERNPGFIDLNSYILKKDLLLPPDAVRR